MDKRLSAFQLLKNQIDNSFLYYKSSLSYSERQTYNNIVSGLLHFKQVIKAGNHSFHTIAEIMEMIILDIPGLFYIKNYTFRQNSEFIEIIPNYRFSREKAAKTLYAVYDTIREFIDNSNKYNTTQKIISVHDLLCRSVKYVDNKLESDHECVGPILFRSGVCEGISKAAKLLFDLLGIQSIVVRGLAINNPSDYPNSHMWNMVIYDDQIHHFDITFDLSLMEYRIIRYDYFGLSDIQIRKDHVFSKDLPHCRYSWNYYEKNRVYFQNLQLLKEYVKKMLRLSIVDIIFQIPTNSFTVKLNVMKESIDQIISGFPIVCAYELFYNEVSGVCHLHLIKR